MVEAGLFLNKINVTLFLNKINVNEKREKAEKNPLKGMK